MENTTLCPHLLLGGLDQSFVGADVDGSPTYLCTDCAVSHILDCLMVKRMGMDRVSELIDFRQCNHLGGSCGMCHSVLISKLAVIALEAKLKGNGNLNSRLGRVLRNWHREYGHAGYFRVTL